MKLNCAMLIMKRNMTLEHMELRPCGRKTGRYAKITFSGVEVRFAVCWQHALQETGKDDGLP